MTWVTVRSLPKTRRYTVVHESAPIGAALTGAALDAFTAAVAIDRKLVDPKPDADLDLGRLELRTASVRRVQPTHSRS